MFLTTPLRIWPSLRLATSSVRCLGAALFEHGAARHDDIAARAVHLEDLERLRRTHQRGDIAHRTDVDLAARQEGDGAVEIDGEAALDAAEDDAGDALVALELFSSRVQASSRRAFSRDSALRRSCLPGAREDLDRVADLDVGRLAREAEFLQVDAALGFEADIDQDDVVLDRENTALEDGAFETARSAEEFVQQGGKAFLLGRFGFRCDCHSNSIDPVRATGNPCRGSRRRATHRRHARARRYGPGSSRGAPSLAAEPSIPARPRGQASGVVNGTGYVARSLLAT